MSTTKLIWQGASLIDGAPIGAFLTLTSANAKTGNMPAVSIMRTDIHPVQAVEMGLDRSICGTCPHMGRGSDAAGRYGVDRSCYVRVAHGPAAIYKAFKRGSVPVWTLDQACEALAGMAVRFGAYGDPGAVPGPVWTRLAAGARRVVGYTHRWRDRPDLSGLCMASCDTPQEAISARLEGWRTFRVTDAAMAMLEREILCPAAPEAGARTQCVSCGLCGGKAGESDRRANIIIPVHGSGKKYAIQQQEVRS